MFLVTRRTLSAVSLFIPPIVTDSVPVEHCGGGQCVSHNWIVGIELELLSVDFFSDFCRVDNSPLAQQHSFRVWG